MYRKFEDIVQKYIKETPNELNQFFLTDKQNSPFQTFYSYFDSHLVGYGVPSINFCPANLLINNCKDDYTGYITFLDNNVFNVPSETYRHLGTNTACQIAVANKLVDLLSSVTLDDFKKFEEYKTSLLEL